MSIGLILLAYLILLIRSLFLVGKSSHVEQKKDVKTTVLAYGIFSLIIYFSSYYISQSKADTELFFVLNICMLLAFWVFALVVLFFKFFFDESDSKLLIRDVLITSLVLIAVIPVILWVKTMGAE